MSISGIEASVDLLHCGQLKRQCGTQLSLVSLTLRSAYTIRTLSGSQLTDSHAPCAVPQDRRLHAATAGRRDRRQPPADRLLRGRVEPPPASLLIALAQALNVSTDALMGVQQARKPARVSTRLECRIKQIERMPAKPKQQLLGIIDTFIAAHQ